MPYPTLANTLSALNGVLSTPADNEVASAWPAVDRQTRNWLYGFLSQFFDQTTGQLLPAAIGGGTIPTGSVYGSNPTNSAQRSIVQGSIQSVDLAAGAVHTSNIGLAQVTTALLALQSVGTAQLVDGSVTLAKLAAGSISGSVIANGAIGSPQLAASAVVAAAIAASAVTNPAIAPQAVTGDKMVAGTTGQILVGGQTVGGQPNCFAPLTLSGAITIDANGNTSFGDSLTSTIISQARIVELSPPSIPCGPSQDATAFGSGNTSASGYSTATPWDGRGVGQGAAGHQCVGWQKVYDPNDIVNVGSGVTTTVLNVGGTNYNTYQRRIYVNQACLLLIKVSIPGYKVGGHKVRITVFPDAVNTGSNQVYWGTSEVAGTGDTTQTRSEAMLVVVFTQPNGLQLPYFYVDWFSSAAVAISSLVSGMGVASATLGDEYYGDITCIRLA